MGHTMITVVLACIMVITCPKQVVGQDTNGEGVEDQLPSVIMINQIAILEATHALKAVLNSTEDDQQQQCEAKEVLVSMRETLKKSEDHQSALLNSSIEAWSALSDVPSTLQAIAQAADAYKRDDGKQTKKMIVRLDRVIDAVEKSSETTTQALQALQDTTLKMVEVLQQSLQLQSETNEHMKNQINNTKDCCNGIGNQMENLVQAVNDIRKDMQGCREGSPCKMMGSSNGGILKRCDGKNRNKRAASPSSCNLCCEKPLGEIKAGSRGPTVQTETIPVKVFPITDMPVIPPNTDCCPSGFMMVGNQCLYISASMSTWFGARRTCVNKGGYIAKPRDRNALAQYIMTYYENKRWFWIERSDLDEIDRDDEPSTNVRGNNCHVFDAGQEDNMPHLEQASCDGTWFFICQHEFIDECSSMRNL